MTDNCQLTSEEAAQILESHPTDDCEILEQKYVQRRAMLLSRPAKREAAKLKQQSELAKLEAAFSILCPKQPIISMTNPRPIRAETSVKSDVVLAPVKWQGWFTRFVLALDHLKETMGENKLKTILAVAEKLLIEAKNRAKHSIDQGDESDDSASKQKTEPIKQEEYIVTSLDVSRNESRDLNKESNKTSATNVTAKNEMLQKPLAETKIINLASDWGQSRIIWIFSGLATAFLMVVSSITYPLLVPEKSPFELIPDRPGALIASIEQLTLPENPLIYFRSEAPFQVDEKSLKNTIDAVINELQVDNSKKILLVGRSYVDDSSFRYSADITKLLREDAYRRAYAVKEALVAGGTPESKIMIIDLGVGKPQLDRSLLEKFDLMQIVEENGLSIQKINRSVMVFLYS